MPAPFPPDDLRFVLARTEPLWEDLRGGRLFLAGGTGFFGRWMLETFLHANEWLGLNAEVVVLGRSPARLPVHLASHPAVSFVAGDVRGFDLPEGVFTHVVHLATDSTSPQDVEDVIVGGTRRLLRLTAERGARRFLFASSGAVYGTQTLERVSETHPGTPTTPYARGKRRAEALVENAFGFDAAIARPFAFVGPGLPLDAHFAIGNFVRDAMAGRPIEVRGDGSAVRSYLDAADLAVWLWTILFRGEGGRAYNVGSERAISIHDLAYLVASAMNVEVHIEGHPGEGTNRYVPDTSRARHEMGLSETFSLEEAIRRFAAHHRTPCTL